MKKKASSNCEKYELERVWKVERKVCTMCGRWYSEFTLKELDKNILIRQREKGGGQETHTH